MDNGNSIGNPYSSSEFALGYFYRGIKEELTALTAETGGQITPDVAARRVADLLYAEAGGQVLDSPQLVPSVRRYPAKRNEKRTGQKKVHVRAHDGSRGWTPAMKAKASKRMKAQWKKRRSKMIVSRWPRKDVQSARVSA